MRTDHIACTRHVRGIRTFKTCAHVDFGVFGLRSAADDRVGNLYSYAHGSFKFTWDIENETVTQSECTLYKDDRKYYNGAP